MPLADIQGHLRRAVVEGEADAVRPLLTGGRDPLHRLAIHQRHYETSLVTGLLTRFPATGWLVGSAALIEPARAFIRSHPPAAPCIAEYGEGFAAWLAESPVAQRVPYVAVFAELDWHLGRMAVAVDRAPVTADALSALPASRLADARLSFQSGVHYLAADWPIDTLMRLFVTDTAPDRLSLGPEPVWLEVRGSRGELGFARLDEADFAFRRALHARESLGAAVDRATAVNATFDAGRAVAALLATSLVVGVFTRRLESDNDQAV
jgi:hypothetical protein